MIGKSNKSTSHGDAADSQITHAEAEDGDDELLDESHVPGVFLGLFRAGLTAPAKTTYRSLELILTASTRDERDKLTKLWRDHKLEELNFVGVVGALLAGCLTSTGSWPTILPNGISSPWTIQCCWYTGIVFSLFSVLTAAQQSIRLHRLSAHKDGLAAIRRSMGFKRRSAEGQIEIRPRRFQIYGWQASVMFLTGSVCAMLLGMCLTVWIGTQQGPLKSGINWWDHTTMLAVTWSTVGFITVLAFLAAQASLASG